MKYFLMMMAALLGVSSLAAKHKIFNQYTHIIKRPDSEMVFSIDTNPVEKKAQDATKKYIADYLVLNTVPLTKQSKTALKKAVLQEENYSGDNIKRCPFEGKYAVVFTKSKKTVMLIISSPVCSKVLVYLPGKAGNSKPYDLAGSIIFENIFK